MSSGLPLRPEYAAWKPEVRQLPARFMPPCADWKIGLSGRLRRRASARADAETEVSAGRPQACGPKRATSVGMGRQYKVRVKGLPGGRARYCTGQEDAPGVEIPSSKPAMGFEPMTD